ncbi:hypothetical protein QE435_005139, partial [Rhizobium sp. SORGH_AS 787]|nr:hypothetical protein [Rhizobium sp. SORGH_AS_0787]
MNHGTPPYLDHLLHQTAKAFHDRRAMSIPAPRLTAADGVTACLIVPSASACAVNYGLAKADAMPSFRYKLFAGEALPVPLAGETAEIILSGLPLSAGYWKAPKLDEERFVFRNGERWYRTGDMARVDSQHGILFAGRANRQMKVHGYRVELRAIEGTLHEVTGRSQVAFLGWPVVADGAAEGIVAFLVRDSVIEGDVQTALRSLLPAYMVPDRIRTLPALHSTPTERPTIARLGRFSKPSKHLPTPAPSYSKVRGSLMVRITFPDGAERGFDVPITGVDLAQSIAPSLRKKSVAMVVDGKLVDLAERIDKDCRAELIGREDPRALELIRHDAAHVLAQAVQELFPGTQATIGPVIENGFFYDFARHTPFTPHDLPAIEDRMHEIVARNQPITREVWSREEARDFFCERGEAYKVELVDAIPEGEDIRIYRQGHWLDLCRGPHMTSTGKIGAAFKLTKVAGAYWRGDAANRMLTRIYGTAFATQAELDGHLRTLEEAEKRDHRKLGREMDLYHFQEEAPGSVFWHPKGWTLFQTLIDYMRKRQAAAGYAEVNTPDIMDRHLWETSGHWQNYREHMFTTKTEDDRDFALKPMNCPGHMLIYKQGLKSYRDMPLKIAEFGKVHRYEPSGALHGLLRVRSFTQDDAHIFCTEDQLTEECIKVNDLILSIYEDFGFRDIRIKLSP